MARKFNQKIVDKFSSELEMAHGRVEGEVKIWSETHVSGGGTTGSGNNVSIQPVTSTNTSWTQFFLKSQSGLEYEVKVPKALGVRTGHRVSLVRFRSQTPAILNHDLGRLHWFPSQVRSQLYVEEYRFLPPMISIPLGLVLSLLYLIPGLLYMGLVYQVHDWNRSSISESIAQYAVHRLDNLQSSEITFTAEFGGPDLNEFINQIIILPE